MATAIAFNWRNIDPVTKDYVETVARLLKKRHAKATEGQTKSTKQNSKKPSVTLAHGRGTAVLAGKDQCYADVPFKQPSSLTSPIRSCPSPTFNCDPTVSDDDDDLLSTLEDALLNGHQNNYNRGSIVYREVDVSDDEIMNCYLSSHA